MNHFYTHKGCQYGNFKFEVVSEDEVRKFLNSINPRKAMGYDMISPRFVYEGREGIVTPLTYLVNLSLAKGEVPEILKQAKVLPLFKKGARDEVGNYRPVSILPVLSKILEKVVFCQLDSYLSKNNLIYDFQSGFRKGFSTNTTLTSK